MPRRSHIAATLGLLLLVGCAGPNSLSSASTTSLAPLASTLATQVAPNASVPPTQVPGPSAPPVAGEAPTLTLEPVVSGLDAPLDVAVRPADPEAMYVAEQAGRVRVVRDGVVAATPYLDIAGQVQAGGERGLLGIAFHPDPEDGRLFVYYTALDGAQVLSSFGSTLDADAADPESETMILRMEDQFGNHNGGALAFGSDGYLYIGTGDGGGAGDPLGSGRSLDTLLAKILRIDIDRTGPDGTAYGIPPDNPYTDGRGARPEIWATGLRNPWRIRFDRGTDDLWIGDVGQGAREEIDVAPTGVSGLDFGWNAMEGSRCFEPAADCETEGLTLPITEYGHDEGCSVTGGAVYRGDAQPALLGWYVFADFCSGRFWVLDADAAGPRQATDALESGRSISAIAEDWAGELYATDLGSGHLLRIVAAGG